MRVLGRPPPSHLLLMVMILTSSYHLLGHCKIARNDLAGQPFLDPMTKYVDDYKNLVFSGNNVQKEARKRNSPGTVTVCINNKCKTRKTSNKSTLIMNVESVNGGPPKWRILRRPVHMQQQELSNQPRNQQNNNQPPERPKEDQLFYRQFPDPANPPPPSSALPVPLDHRQSLQGTTVPLTKRPLPKSQYRPDYYPSLPKVPFNYYPQQEPQNPPPTPNYPTKYIAPPTYNPPPQEYHQTHQSYIPPQTNVYYPPPAHVNQYQSPNQYSPPTQHSYPVPAVDNKKQINSPTSSSYPPSNQYLPNLLMTHPPYLHHTQNYPHQQLTSTSQLISPGQSSYGQSSASGAESLSTNATQGSLLHSSSNPDGDQQEQQPVPEIKGKDDMSIISMKIQRAIDDGMNCTTDMSSTCCISNKSSFCFYLGTDDNYQNYQMPMKVGKDHGYNDVRGVYLPLRPGNYPFPPDYKWPGMP